MHANILRCRSTLALSWWKARLDEGKSQSDIVVQRATLFGNIPLIHSAGRKVAKPRSRQTCRVKAAMLAHLKRRKLPDLMDKYVADKAPQYGTSQEENSVSQSGRGGKTPRKV